MNLKKKNPWLFGLYIHLLSVSSLAFNKILRRQPLLIK